MHLLQEWWAKAHLPTAGVTVALMLILGAIMWPSDEEPIDLVNDLDPVSTEFYHDQPFMEAVQNAYSAEERMHVIQAYHPRFENQLALQLRRTDRIPTGAEISDIALFYGSLDNVEADDVTGARHVGSVENQLIARVSVAGVSESIDVIVRCMNGLFATPAQFVAANLERVGNMTPLEVFVIQPGESLIQYVGFQSAIDIAENAGLRVYTGRGFKPENEISYDEARALENHTDEVQVSIKVHPGDRFDLQNGFHESPRTGRAVSWNI